MKWIGNVDVRAAAVGLVVGIAATPLALQSIEARYVEGDGPPAAHRSIVDVRIERTVLADVGSVWQVRTREGTIERLRERMAAYNVSRDLAEAIYDAAIEANIDPEVAFGLVRAESSFRNTATSRVGAVGLTQLMPRTARWMQPGVTHRDLRTPETNLRIGFAYLRYLLDKYDEDLDLALLAYNRGPGTVDRVLRRGGNPHNGYVDMVLSGP